MLENFSEDFSNQIKISVIIPYYNGKRFIEPCLHGVSVQTLQPFETIVVNDGSDDASTQVIEQLVEKYPIKLFSKANGGQSSARNLGVRLSEGNLLAFLDQDDVWKPNHLEELVKPFFQTSAAELGWVYASMDLVDIDGTVICPDFLSRYPGKHPKKSLLQCLSEDMMITPTSALISKQAFDDVGGFDENLSGYEDDDLFLRLFDKGYRHIFLNQSLYQWRVHRGSCVWSPRMVKSAMVYAKKLMTRFPCDTATGTDYITEAIAPRFINIIKSGYLRGLRHKDERLAKVMYANLQELLSYRKPTALFKIKLFLSEITLVYFLPLVELYEKFFPDDFQKFFNKYL